MNLISDNEGIRGKYVYFSALMNEVAIVDMQSQALPCFTRLGSLELAREIHAELTELFKMLDEK